MIIGYANLPSMSDKTSIDETRQALIAAGAETVYLDTGRTALPASRNGLDAALQACEPGDTLLALSPALMATSIDELIATAGQLTSRGAHLRVLEIAGNQMLDTSTPAGSMLLGALGLLAAFNPPATSFGQAPHRGVAADEGKSYLMHDSFAPRRSRGRPPTASTQATEITQMREAGMRATDIADRLKICRASVYRVLNMATIGRETAPQQENASAFAR
jgi:DNA invertase Pin-like site-specific DNA recombinase